jgi:hypothetical protein
MCCPRARCHSATARLCMPQVDERRVEHRFRPGGATCDNGGRATVVVPRDAGGGQTARHGCTFDTFFEDTPSELLERGIYSQIAVPLKGDPWRPVSMVQLAQALGVRMRYEARNAGSSTLPSRRDLLAAARRSSLPKGLSSPDRLDVTLHEPSNITEARDSPVQYGRRARACGKGSSHGRIRDHEMAPVAHGANGPAARIIPSTPWRPRTGELS